MIVVTNAEGIGNKLKNIVSALRRADHADDRVEVRFAHYDLFSLAQTRKAKDAEQHLHTWQLILAESEHDQNILKETNPLVQISSGAPFIQRNSIDFQYDNILEEVRSTYLNYFSKIVFYSSVLDPVRAFCQRHEVENCIGIQIRSWNDHPARKRHLFDLSMFEAAIEANRTRQFFVSSDDLEIVRGLARKYGRQIVWFEKQRLAHSATEASKEMLSLALIDLLILSRTASIVGSYQSTFTEVAWWLGGACKPVVIPTTKVISELNKAANKALTHGSSS